MLKTTSSPGQPAIVGLMLCSKHRMKHVQSQCNKNSNLSTILMKDFYHSNVTPEQKQCENKNKEILSSFQKH